MQLFCARSRRLATLSGNHRSDYYAAQLPPRQGLMLTLDSQASGDANEIYAANGRIPTRQDYDYRVAAGTPDAQLLIPASYDGGTYYVMGYANQVSATAPYQLRGQLSPVMLARVTPDHITTGAPVTLARPSGWSMPTRVTHPYPRHC